MPLPPTAGAMDRKLDQLLDGQQALRQDQQVLRQDMKAVITVLNKYTQQMDTHGKRLDLQLEELKRHTVMLKDIAGMLIELSRREGPGKRGR